MEIGELAGGRYRIDGRIGTGGMSTVWHATEESTGRVAAIKQIRPDGKCDYPAVRQAMAAEAELLRGLSHPNLPNLIEVVDREDCFFVVMEYIPGESLLQIVNREGALPAERVIPWAVQLCDALNYLHTRKAPILYRDMKPANVILQESGRVKLIDFGTAMVCSPEAPSKRDHLGTRGYAAPEQFGDSSPLDPRTDIFGLGATMYHLLSGHNPALPPFEIHPLSHWDPTYAGTGLEKIVSRCCAADPADRPANCAELIWLLQHAQRLDDPSLIRKRRWNAFLAALRGKR